MVLINYLAASYEVLEQDNTNFEAELRGIKPEVIKMKRLVS